MPVRRHLSALSALLVSCALLPDGEAATPGIVGYLAPGSVPEGRELLPAPPAAGSSAEALDRAIFFATRELKGTPRWELATRDAVYSPPAFLEHFACSLGARPEVAQVPALLRVVTRLEADVGTLVNSVKAQYKRPRPFVGTDAPICGSTDREATARNWSYPSGHATMAWATGLLLTELAPDTTARVLARARDLGESRLVCGVHALSDVEAGRTLASALVALLHASAEFKTDLEAARRELATARKAPVPATEGARCAVERDVPRAPWPMRP